MKIAGIQKLSLLDYPDKTCAVIFTQGCNFRCPFCHNSSLVCNQEENELIKEEEIISFLGRRKGLLDGVCITGGEPLLQEDIKDFIQKVKEMGFLIKLDTNGGFPDRLKALLEFGIIDYLAMDIKNSPKKYNTTAGTSKLNIADIIKSIEIIKNSGVPYEFRTTVVREFHTLEDIKEIVHLISGAKTYCIQGFKDSGSVIKPGLTGYEEAELVVFSEQIKDFFDRVVVRV